MRTKQAGASLNEVAKRLQIALGPSAPARITLHRHSAAGSLERYVVRRTDSRKYYDADSIVEHYRSRAGSSSDEPSASVPPGAPAALAQNLARELAQDASTRLGSLLEERIARGLALDVANHLESILMERITQDLARGVGPLIEDRIAQALTPLQSVLENLSRQIGDLSAVRQSLMLKYDATAALTQQRLEQAEAELKKTRAGGSSSEMMVAKIAIEVANIKGAVNELVMQLRDRPTTT